VLPGRPPYRYAFTPGDAVWLARFVAAIEGRVNARGPAPVWRLFERYASTAMQRGGQDSFRIFVQQLFPSLQRTPWRQLPVHARRRAFNAVMGRSRRGSQYLNVQAPDQYGAPQYGAPQYGAPYK
jgi:hypothetical protein